jgi:Arc/MetJ family transcription regulator
MRTTLTLDDDVAAKLKAEARLAGRPFREIVNEMLRRYSRRDQMMVS